MMQGDGGVIYGLKNKAQVVLSRIAPSEWKARKHREMAAPGTGEQVKNEEGRE
jgi:hypothetical protein